MAVHPDPCGFTYRDVGATRREDEPAPAGFHPLRVRTRLGSGRAVQRRAGQAVLEWRMHRAVGVRVRADASRAAPGVTVMVGLGAGPLRLTAPCRVVWTVHEADRAGFAYGTLAGHPSCGEEAFLVERRADDSVWLTVTAFTRAARWYTRLTGPLTPAAQRAYARRCGRVLRRLSAE